MYGQTEATARLSYLPPDRALDKHASVGRGLDNVELAVVDGTGRALPPREVGEVVARGPSIMPGYHAAPEATAEVLHDGWLWTGDLGYLDEEGFLFLVGRAKDMLKLSGHRVAAAEIERILAEHPGVQDAAVVGTKDDAGAEFADFPDDECSHYATESHCCIGTFVPGFRRRRCGARRCDHHSRGRYH
jgi:acyl-CoA synthetase (AMP-forming)/AMP-acid ligase II